EMELLGLIIIGLVIWFVIRNNATKTAAAQTTSGPQPDYFFKGKADVSLEAIARRGDGSIPFTLTILKSRGCIKVSYFRRGQSTDYYIRFDEIDDVWKRPFETGELGTYAMSPTVIETHCETFPFNEIYIDTTGRGYDLCDKLKAALKEFRQ